MHAAELRVDLIVVQMQALALPVVDLQALGDIALVDGERHARIDALQHADETGRDPVGPPCHGPDLLCGGRPS